VPTPTPTPTDEGARAHFQELRSERAKPETKRSPSPTPEPHAEDQARQDAADIGAPQARRTIAEIVAPTKVAPSIQTPAISPPPAEAARDEVKQAAAAPAPAPAPRQDRDRDRHALTPAAEWL
jgi:hypothetical protein